MKKLIGIVALGMAMSVSAANLVWGDGYDVLDTNGDPWSGTIYLMDSNTQSASDFLAAWIGGTEFSTLAANAINSATYDNYALSAPATGSVNGNDEITWADASYPTGQTSFYQVALNGDNLYISDVIDVGVAATGSTMINGFANNEEASSFAANTTGVLGSGASWYGTPSSTPTDVPEPTSGLLLAIGCTMLALRRRRA